MTDDRQAVLIIGGGFAGLTAAQQLDRHKFSVTLLDRRNFHLFQPLLYQVATGSLDASDIATPLREILVDSGVRVLMEEAVSIDTATKCVTTLAGNRYTFDYLIVATGVWHSYFGHDDWRAFAGGLKTLEDAFRMRAKILSALEMAERQTQDSGTKRHLRFVVIGGGPTGVEIAGAVGELTGKSIAREFSKVNPGAAEVILLEAGPRILAQYSAGLAADAESRLNRLGVTVKAGCKVTAIDAHGVSVEDDGVPGVIDCATVIWAAGVQVPTFGRHLLDVTNSTPAAGGRSAVDADFRLPNQPHIFVIGDLASYSHEGSLLPGLAPAAQQAGAHVAGVLNGKVKSPFHYVSHGQLAVIGRNAAVGVVMGREVKGFLAWILWVFVHIQGLIGFDVKIKVMLSWAWKYLTTRFGTRLITRLGDETP